MKQVYTDGSCLGNPGPGGWAVIVVENDKVVNALCGYCDDTTNNRMELVAIIQALNEYQDDPIIIYSDSAYCVNMYNNWMDTWKENGWVRSGGKKIENLDLVERMYWAKWLSNCTQVTKVAGHSGNMYNELADKLATKQITKEEVLEKYG